MTLEKLLSQMFPGDVSSGLPKFSSLTAQKQKFLSTPEIEEVTTLLQKCIESESNNDVNDILKHMTYSNPDLMKKFTVAAIEAYFSQSGVVFILRKGNTTLFPHEAVLPTFDFDLVEPVLSVIPNDNRSKDKSTF
jgi:hypothetical protein